tara:strand:+ start:1259 stop:1399 length:141 start_codon:yes stop_codon:yes gene_type:complete
MQLIKQNDKRFEVIFFIKGSFLIRRFESNQNKRKTVHIFPEKYKSK